MEKKKVSIAIPMQQHSFQTAIGLIDHGLLDRYYTTVYFNDKSVFLKLVVSLLPSDLSKRLRKRRDERIDDYAVTFLQIVGLLSQFIVRFPSCASLYKELRKGLFKYFAKQTANDISRRKTEIVWTFDSFSLAIYKALGRYHADVIIILDMASTAAPVIQRIIAEEQSKGLTFSHTYEFNKSMYSDEQIENYKEEFKYADYFLSPSDWVTRSLIESGIPSTKILYLPHGVDVNKFQPKSDSYVPNKKLRFLFVGRVEAAKGIDYLFEAFKQMQNIEIELQVVGSTFSWNDEVCNYSPNINVLGLKRNEEMPAVYANADVYILSSLWEGSSLSLLEAMASGMPIIASSHSAAPEIVHDGVEGFVYDPYNIEQLKRCVRWYVDNKDSIKNMGIAARKKAEQYTWDKYYDNVAEIIQTINERENSK